MPRSAMAYVSNDPATLVDGMPPRVAMCRFDTDAIIPAQTTQQFVENVLRTRTVWVYDCDSFMPLGHSIRDVVYDFAKSMLRLNRPPQFAKFVFAGFSQYARARPHQWWSHFKRSFVDPLRECGVERVGCFGSVNVDPVDSFDWLIWEDAPVPVSRCSGPFTPVMTPARFAGLLNAHGESATLAINETDSNAAAMCNAARARGMDILLIGATGLSTQQRAAQNAITAELFARHRQDGGR